VSKATWIVILIAFTSILVWSVYRDIQLDKYYPGDLRNRVVGARLIKDGRSPYFYKWENGDGIRYYDPSSFDSLKVSNITATPFFHHLLSPLAELPERQLSRWWLAIEYIMLLLSVVMALSMTVNKTQRWLVLGATGLLLLTEAWKNHISHGQNYLCIVFLAMLFCYLIQKKQTIVWGAVAGIVAISLVLIKPYTLFFFIPFLFIIKKFSRQYIMALLLPVLVIAGWTAINTRERFLWQDYKLHIDEQVKAHQKLGPAMQINTADPKFAKWEGIDTLEIARLYIERPVHEYSENGNVFFIVEKIFHTTIPVRILYVLALTSMAIMTALFYIRHRRRQNGYHWPSIALLGFCLFMTADLFSPVYRHQYYTVQWIFPVLLAAATYTPSQKRLFFLLACGVLLNIINIAFLKMEHTIGEYILLAALLMLSFSRKPTAE
jgi:hypothetical protein